MRRTPIIDLGNEVILKVVYSMMGFTKSEIDGLEEQRSELPVYTVDSSKTKAKQAKKSSSLSQVDKELELS